MPHPHANPAPSTHFNASPILLAVLMSIAVSLSHAQSQPPDPAFLQTFERVKTVAAHNRQLLAQYSWMEQDIVSVKGKETHEQVFGVQLGPDGKLQKTPLDLSDDDRARFGLRAKVAEKKMVEYEEYTESLVALAQQYVPPDVRQLEWDAQHGKLKMDPESSETTYHMVTSSFVQQGDRMLLAFDKTQDDMVTLWIDTYLDQPANAVNIDVQFARMPSGPTHPSAVTGNLSNKELIVTIHNFNYQHL
ncbi:MAG TPA: hypothetical protein VF753_12325 [Terriglobales bacterium]